MSTSGAYCYLTLREAAQSAGIPENYFKNYAFKGGELKVEKIGEDG